jgi:hypothetical protein
MFCMLAIWAHSQSTKQSELQSSFAGGYGQAEVGGRFVGAEFHRSRPLPSRISFYYPVANSIDLSTDYWKRFESLPMAIGVQFDNGPRRLIGREAWTYTVSPHEAIFHSNDEHAEYTITYRFCLNEPAMVWSVCVKNIQQMSQKITLYTHVKPVLRTCQTYARKDSARVALNQESHAVQVNFDDADADSASVFVQNVGAIPSGSGTDAAELAASDSGTSNWISGTSVLSGSADKKVMAAVDKKIIPAAAFQYEINLGPGDSLAAVQVIGSCRRSEASAMAHRLRSSWHAEVNAYDSLITTRSLSEARFTTHDAVLDASAAWAKAILAANAHYINGAIVPMPCPAEYNFFFTHDVLMTDLGAVNFDLPRVRTDLNYVASLAKDTIIPHAYYWRDDGFKTEYCTPDNWNHFWFIIVNGTYLRHSHDRATARALYPLVTKSLQQILTQLQSDHLMYAFRPDWWDIGHIYGPRAYMTALAIRSLREYLFISSFLHMPTHALTGYERLADSMQVALTDRLWDEKMNYLINYNDGKKDGHYYMGSLLAVAYDLLDAGHGQRLVRTATERLLDKKIGVRAAMPPDFHTKESIDFYKFAGEEAGKPFVYINGGVWPHNNAWYAMALNATGEHDAALTFVKATMTVNGIEHSPNGQPAMYEYRMADPASAEYGSVDKPMFLWAGGFYLKTLYTLFGVRENEWNISLETSLPSGYDSVTYTLTDGMPRKFALSGSGKYLASLTQGRDRLPSLVLPVDRAARPEMCSLRRGKPDGAYLKSMGAILNNVRRNGKNELSCTLESFSGHKIVAVVISPSPAKRVAINGVTINTFASARNPDGVVETRIRFTGTDKPQTLTVRF